MKPIGVFFYFLIGAILFSSCKNDVKNNQETTSVITDSIPTASSPEYMYVTAVSGLTLRAKPNLQSEKLAVLPLGTKVKLIDHDKDPTLNVGGIEGAMDKVKYEGRAGYVFNGFIMKFPFPGTNVVPKHYFEDIEESFPKISYTETTGGTARKPTKTQTVILPTDKWHEGFFMAQQLYGIPRQFAFPNPKGANNESQHDGNKKKNDLISELVITRNANTLQRITYNRQIENLGQTVTIVKEGNGIKIEKTEKVE